MQKEKQGSEGSGDRLSWVSWSTGPSVLKPNSLRLKGVQPQVAEPAQVLASCLADRLVLSSALHDSSHRSGAQDVGLGQNPLVPLLLPLHLA